MGRKMHRPKRARAFFSAAGTWGQSSPKSRIQEKEKECKQGGGKHGGAG